MCGELRRREAELFEAIQYGRPVPGPRVALELQVLLQIGTHGVEAAEARIALLVIGEDRKSVV